MEKARRRRQILQAAARVFAARGYHQTSVSDIIEQAAIARGTFYLYFESKRAVFGELIDRFQTRFQDCVRRIEIAPGSPPPFQQLRANFSRVLALLLDDRDMTVILLNHAVGLDKESDEKLTQFWERIAGALERGLETGRRIGLVDVRDVEIAARIIIGGTKEVAHRLVVQNGRPRDHDRLVDEILRVSLRGVIEDSYRDLLASPAEAPRLGPAPRLVGNENS